MREPSAERLELFSKRLLAMKIDSAIISDPRHIFYFTSFLTYKSRLNTFLLVNPRKGEHLLFVGQTEEGTAEKAFSGKVETYKDYDIGERMVAYPDYLLRGFGKLVGHDGLGTSIGIEDWHLPQVYAAAIKGKKRGISELILFMRRRKGKDEQSYHQDAAKRLDRVYRLAREYARSGRTEIGLYQWVNGKSFEREGAVESGRYSNVLGDFVSGRRTLDVGGPPTEKRLADGDTLIMDLQASSNAYWADTARTIVIGRVPLSRQRRTFETLLDAKHEAENVLRPGTRGSEVYEIVSRVMRKVGFPPLQHHAGHGLGLEVQEAPFFLPNSNDIIEEDDICALEPGIYDKEGGGMRIEDDYIITKEGFRKTSNSAIALD